MLRRFTDQSRLVLIEAQDIATVLASRWIDAGHLLYACAEVGGPTSAEPMRRFGLSAATVRESLVRDRGSGARCPC